MFLPSMVTTGFLASAFTSAVPFPAAATPPPRIPVDALPKMDTASKPYSWENSHTCVWHTDASSSAFVCGSPLICATNTDNVVTCTMDQDPPDAFHTTSLNLEDYRSRKCGPTASRALCCGESSMMGECVSIFWTGSSTRSMFNCDSTSTIISLFDEPAYIAAESTSGETTSSESNSSQKPSSESTTRKSTSRLIWSSSLPPSTSSASAISASASTTDSASHSSKKSTSSTSSSTSSSKASLSTTTSSSLSSDVSSDATTTSPTSSISSKEPSLSSSHTSIAPVITSQTSMIIDTTTSIPAPTYSVGVPTSPPTDTSGLSTAAKGGIGAGAGAGLLLLLTAVALVLFKKRKARDEPVQHNTWPMHGRPGGPAPATTQHEQPPPRPPRPHSPSQQPRVFWHRGPRSDADVADDLDLGVGGSEVPVDMRGQGFGGGAVELDGGGERGAAAAGGAAAAAEALVLMPPRRDPSRDSWRSHHDRRRRRRRHHDALAESARPYAGRYGAAPDQLYGLVPEEPHSTASQLSSWHGSDRSWGAL